MISGWVGWGILDAVRNEGGKVLSRSFVRLNQYGYYRGFLTSDNQNNNGSLFLVQDCE